MPSLFEPFQVQIKLYRAILKSKLVRGLLLEGRGEGIDALPAISMLRKLCNHPCLLTSTADLPEECSLELEKLSGCPDNFSLSGEL